MPFASGIIDDLIVKAKVFGTSLGQFLLSFLKIFVSSLSALVMAPRFAEKLIDTAALMWSEKFKYVY